MKKAFNDLVQGVNKNTQFNVDKYFVNLVVDKYFVNLVEDQIAKLQAWNNPANTFFIMLCACYFTLPWKYQGGTCADQNNNRIKKEGKIH